VCRKEKKMGGGRGGSEGGLNEKAERGKDDSSNGQTEEVSG